MVIHLRLCGVIKLGVHRRLDWVSRFAQGLGHLSSGGAGEDGAAGESVLVAVLNHGSDRFRLALVLIVIHRGSDLLGGGGGVEHGCERYARLMFPVQRRICRLCVPPCRVNALSHASACRHGKCRSKS